jgi:hypothetical protein
MKRFVIHIKGSSRYERMLKEMNTHYEGEFEIFDAIVNQNPRKGISDSFKKIITDNYNEECIHIFEDDVKFTAPKSRIIFEQSFVQIPEDWQLFLGGSYTYENPIDFGDYMKVDNFRSLHSVIIRKSAYDLFLSHNPTEIYQNIDSWVAKQKPIVYLCNPQAMVQHDGYSYNARKQTDYSRFLKDKNILN